MMDDQKSKEPGRWEQSEEFMESTGRCFKHRRERMDITIYELAKTTAISIQEIAEIEAGISYPLHHYFVLALALGVPVNALLPYRDRHYQDVNDVQAVSATLAALALAMHDTQWVVTSADTDMEIGLERGEGEKLPSVVITATLIAPESQKESVCQALGLAVQHLGGAAIKKAVIGDQQEPEVMH